MRAHFVLLVLLLTSSAYCEAAFLTAGDLLNLCKSYTSGEEYNNLGERTCTGYVMAVHDTAKSYENLFVVPPLYCVPPRVTSDRMILIVKRYLQKNPELLQSPASPKVIDAFIEEFPCN